MYKITFYAPHGNVEDIKNAMFKAGAGKIGNYGFCSWQVLGEGQYLPLAGSNPHQGSTYKLEKVSEYLVEMVCADDYINDVIAALRQAHPYEEPAFQVIRCEDF